MKLRHLDDWNARRQAIAAAYLDGLADTELTLPHVPDWAEPVWHLFVVRHPQRDALQQRLTAAGIGTLIHYPIPPHRQEAYAQFDFAPDAFPIAARIADELLSLPIGPQLRPSQRDAVINRIQSNLAPTLNS